MNLSPLRSHAIAGAAISTVVLALLAFGVARGWIPGGRETRALGPELRVPAGRSAAPVNGTDTAECALCGTVEYVRVFESRFGTSAFPYRVTVHMDDGSYRTFPLSERDAFAIGARVRVVDGALVALRR